MQTVLKCVMNIYNEYKTWILTKDSIKYYDNEKLSKLQ